MKRESLTLNRALVLSAVQRLGPWATKRQVAEDLRVLDDVTIARTLRHLAALEWVLAKRETEKRNSAMLYTISADGLHKLSKYPLGNQ